MHMHGACVGVHEIQMVQETQGNVHEVAREVKVTMSDEARMRLLKLIMDGRRRYHSGKYDCARSFFTRNWLITY